MKPLETGLHAVSLACCVALGAGVWTLAERQAAPPPPAAPSSPPELRDALREIAALRLEVAELREARAAAQAQAESRIVPAAPVPTPAVSTPAAVQAALADPAVQKQVQEMVDARIKAGREAQEKEWSGRRQEDARRWTERRVEELAKDLGLNEVQAKDLGGAVADLTKRFDDLRSRVRAKELTPEQGKAEMEKTYAELDLKLQGTLSAEQYGKFQEETRSIRESTLRNGFSQDGRSRRGGRSRDGAP